MAMAFTTTNSVQPLSTVNSRSHDKPLFNPLKTTSSFLGSTRKLHLPNFAKLNQPNLHYRSAVITVSNVVKEKKLKSTSNLVNNFTISLFLYDSRYALLSYWLLQNFVLYWHVCCLR
ncbi:hypothetical protein ACOSP7_030563 [Xanthoceras sorbifolium]